MPHSSRRSIKIEKESLSESFSLVYHSQRSYIPEEFSFTLLGEPHILNASVLFLGTNMDKPMIRNCLPTLGDTKPAASSIVYSLSNNP